MALMKLILIFLLSCALMPFSAFAEIEKLAIPSCNDKICFIWWPKITAPEGWHHDHKASLRYGFNAFTPDGSTFANAETVMYVRACYKPRDPETKSLAMLIEKDKKVFSTDFTIAETGSLKTADGKELISLTFFPHDRGNWERVSYGEEGDFYLVFTISSRSRLGFNDAKKQYEQFVASYKEKP